MKISQIKIGNYYTFTSQSYEVSVFQVKVISFDCQAIEVEMKGGTRFYCNAWNLSAPLTVTSLFNFA